MQYLLRPSCCWCLLSLIIGEFLMNKNQHKGMGQLSHMQRLTVTGLSSCRWVTIKVKHSCWAGLRVGSLSCAGLSKLLFELGDQDLVLLVQ
ncbi:hypothetical protein M5K25_000799 [Dendrobium thyrsiflorum]|uniref:Secreted protein n=1 Tax=Dendrobium thyrsiflorum TaxID=117978 RepID=A0ABD0W6T4_DENTH